jgi:hypothetical protein
MVPAARLNVVQAGQFNSKVFDFGSGIQKLFQ